MIIQQRGLITFVTYTYIALILFNRRFQKSDITNSLVDPNNIVTLNNYQLKCMKMTARQLFHSQMCSDYWLNGTSTASNYFVCRTKCEKRCSLTFLMFTFVKFYRAECKYNMLMEAKTSWQAKKKVNSEVSRLSICSISVYIIAYVNVRVL